MSGNFTSPSMIPSLGLCFLVMFCVYFLNFNTQSTPFSNSYREMLPILDIGYESNFAFPPFFLTIFNRVIKNASPSYFSVAIAIAPRDWLRVMV